MKKIAIMHLRSSSGSGGGPEKTILLSAEKIDKERFNMIIVYLKGEDDLIFSIAKKAQEKRLNFHTILERRRLDWKAISTILGLLKRYQIDILHCHGYKSNVLGLLLSRWCSVKLITTTHGWIGNDPKERFYNWLDRIAIRYCDMVIAVSEVMRGCLSSVGVPAQRLVTIHNAVDLEDFRADGELGDIRREINIDRKDPVVGAVGRLSREKDLRTLLLVAKEVISKVGNVKFLIVGEGPELVTLTALAKKLRIERDTFFLGQRKDIKRIYNTMDLLVSTSITEGLPNTVLEALAIELPVVATDVGGVGEIIKHGENGLLFRPEDIDGIAGGIVRLLLDQRMARGFAKEGRKIVCEKFSFDERMRKVERLYLELLERRERSIK